MAIEFLDEIAPPAEQKKKGVEFIDNPPSGSTIEFLDEPSPRGGHGASGAWTQEQSAGAQGAPRTIGAYPGTSPSGNKSIDTYRQGLDAFLNGDRETANKFATEAYRLDPKNIEARNMVERIQRDPMAGTVKPTFEANKEKPEIPSSSVAVNLIKGLPGFAQDVASQAAQETASAGVYMGAGAVRGATMGYVDPTSLIEKSPYLSGANVSKQTAENVGSAIGAIAPIAAISKGVGAGVKAAQVFNNVRPWLQSIFQAGVTGGVFGAARKPGENETRAQNAADDAGLFMAFTGAAHGVQRAFVKDIVIPDAKKAEVLQKATDAGIDAYAKGGSKAEAGRIFTETLDAEAKAAREAVKAGAPGTQNIQPQGYKEQATLVRTPTALSNAINRIIERVRKPSVGVNKPIDVIATGGTESGGIGQDVAPIDNGPTSGYPASGQGVTSFIPPGGANVSLGMVSGGSASPSVSVTPNQGGQASPQIPSASKSTPGVVSPQSTGSKNAPVDSSPSGEVSPAEPAVTPTKKYRIPKADIQSRAEALWHQAMDERGSAVGLEQFIIENNGMRSNSDTKEEFQSVPIHLRGNTPVDEMRQMAVDAGIPNVPDDLTYWAGTLKKRGAVPKKYMFLEEAKRELEHEYETYGYPSQRDTGPRMGFGNAEPIPFETKAPYGVKEQQDLFAAPKENVGQAFDRLVAHAKQQGFSQPEAMAYAKRTLATQGRGVEATQGGQQAAQMEMGAPGGVEGFGRGQRGQTDLFASAPSGGMTGIRQFFDFIRARNPKAAENAIRSVDTPTLIEFTNSKQDGSRHPYLRQEVAERFIALRNKGEIPQRADYDEWVKNGGTLNKGSLFEEQAKYGTNGPVFYSQLQRTIEEKMPNSAPAVMVRNLVDPSNGNVKAEEAEWSGINEFLNGKEKVSKAELLDFLKSNEVQIKEVVKGNSGGDEDIGKLESKIDRIRSRFQIYGYQIENNAGWTQIIKNEEMQSVDSLPENLRSDVGEFMSAQNDIARLQRNSGQETKFKSYQLPGGENYREVLLTLPGKGEFLTGAESSELKKLNVMFTEDRTPEQQARFSYLANKSTRVNMQPGFRSSHFDEPNIIAHVRMNDRTTANGKKVLFLEEVQSDWHQKGREKGYRSGQEKPNIESIRKQPDGKWTVIVNGRESSGWNGSNESSVREQIIDGWNRTGLSSVPNAPFKKTWHELALKRMLRYAADNGYDGIAWTKGDVQVERYREALRKAVDRVEWTKQKDGVRLVGFKDGAQVVDTTEKENAVSDAIGKSMGSKILDDSAQSGILQGEDITISDTGMSGFYDKIIPNFLNKYTKKWGGEVAQAKINVGPSQEAYDAFHEAERTGDSALIADAASKGNGRMAIVHALNITPSMRESVSQGQAMFEKKSPYAAGPNHLDLWRPTGEGQHQRPVDIPKALRESVVVKELQETGFLDVHTTTITSPEDTAAIFSFMQNNNMESMYAIGMDGAGKMLGVQMVGMGNINQIPISTRDTLAGMRAMGAAKISFAHNHTSHDPDPSPEDIELTKILGKLAESVDMELLHHIVIDDTEFGLIDKYGKVEFRPFDSPKHITGKVRIVAPQQEWTKGEVRQSINQPEIAARVIAGFQQKNPGIVLLALNSKNKINGVWHIASSLPVNPDKLVAEAGKIAMRNAAASVILSSNINPNSTYIKYINKGLSQWGVDLLDWVGFDGGTNPVFSAHNSGMISESRASYGTPAVDTPAFKQWFGDSVVTDNGKPMSEGGKPLVVYHGGLKFNTFGINDRELRIGKRPDGFALQEHVGDGNWTWTGPPFKTEQEVRNYLDEIPKTSAAYATESQDVAESYADQYGNSEQEVKALYLNLANPLDLRDPVLYKKWVGGIGDTFNAQELNMAHGSREIRSGGKVLSDAKKAGYDGVIFYDTDVYDKGAETAYAFFSPNQAKSATGNSGAFNPKNPSILKESGSGYGGKPPTPPVSHGSDFGSGDAYEANRLLAKKGSFTHHRIGEVIESAKNFAETILTPISTVLKNIDPSLKVAIRHHVFTALKSTHDDLHASMPLMKKADTMSPEDQADLDLAGKNGDVDKIKEIVSRHGAWAEYDAYRRTMDTLRDRAIASGVDMGYLSDYFPRIVQDKAGFLDAVQADMRWPDISAMIEQAEMKGVLSDDDKIAIINNYLRGYSQGVINIKTPGNVKTRTIAILSPQMNQFYMDWRPAAIRYVEGMNKMIADRSFFGKSAKNVDDGPDLFGINKNKIDTEKSIGAFVKDAVESGRVKRLDERTLRETLDAYFNQKTPGLFIKMYRDITTMQTIGNAIAAMTQLQDLGFSFYRAPLQAIPKFMRAFANRSDIKLTDLGLDSIAEEFSTRTRLSRSVSAVLKFAGMTSLDRITAETSINAIVEKYRSQARRGMVGGLEERLRALVGDRWKKVAEDLANGKTSPDVLELAFNEILDVQPKAQTELPRGYLKGGNARIFYMLKTFQLRQLDYFRAEAFSKMAQPGLKNKAIGMGRLLSMVAVLGAMGVATDALKDWVLGRKTKIEDRVIDNILKLAGLSKWTIYKARQEGMGSALMKTILPPAPIIDQLWKDVATAGDRKGLESVQSIPLVGKGYYWRFGRGREKTLAKHPELRYPQSGRGLRQTSPRARPAGKARTLRQRTLVKR